MGRWRTQEQIARKRKERREYSKKRKMTSKQMKRRREIDRRRRNRQRLLRLLPERLWLVEQSWPKEVAIARLAIGGTTKAERETAERKLELILKKEKREWLSQLIISSAMQTTRPVTSFPLSLESSREG